ncbi:MAG: hypothetical protein JW776_08170 [Candidatus Lokiarchaeota archaeon]|nr:hypothetical protein [Candidatus Lokiarchaeota archaeon]
MVIEDIIKLTFQNPNVQKESGSKAMLSNFLNSAVEYTLFFKSTVQEVFNTEMALKKSILIWGYDNG